MKQLSIVVFFFALSGSFLTHCAQQGDCGETFAITRILPAASVPAGAVLTLRGAGFDEAAIVRIGRERVSSAAISLEKIAEFPGMTLPEGLALLSTPSYLQGPNELTVQEGECIARAKVELLGNVLPGSIGGSAFFFVPAPASVFPANFSNQWQDLADSDHELGLFSDFPDEKKLANFSNEFHNSVDTLNNNPISGRIDPPHAFLIIDRSDKNVAIKRDTLLGRYAAPDPKAPAAKATLWLISINTGKELRIAIN
jgi:hypothetical protein